MTGEYFGSRLRQLLPRELTPAICPVCGQTVDTGRCYDGPFFFYGGDTCELELTTCCDNQDCGAELKICHKYAFAKTIVSIESYDEEAEE